MVHHIRKKATPQKKQEINKNKEDTDSCKLTACGCRGACISKNDYMKGRGFNESNKDENETKQNKTKNVTAEKGNIASANKKTPGGYKFAPLVVYEL